MHSLDLQRCYSLTNRSAVLTSGCGTDLHRELLNALCISPKTVLLVTHNIEDAVLLSDIVYVASGLRLSSLTSFHISSDKPRQPSDPCLIETVGTIAQYMLKTASIMEDQHG